MKYILLILSLIHIIINLNAQNLCDGHEKPIGGIPKELYRGRLKVEGALYGNPYTLMDRKAFPIANDGFAAIRKAIQQDASVGGNGNEKGISVIYNTIYQTAIRSFHYIDSTVEAGDFEDGKSKTASPMADWAKCNAFVFVIGLDANNSFVPLAPSSPQRLQFRENAKEAFKNMNCRVYGKDLQNIMHNFVFTWPLVPMSAAIFSAIDATDKLQGRERELMMYCEAYDWLKASAHDSELVANNVEAYPAYDGDRSETDCTARNNLRLFARNFYITANGVLGPIESPTGWKKNHGIMAASAIGMAALVLNDAGVERNFVKALFSFVRPAPNYSPINWNELGQKAWENLLTGDHVFPFANVPQTSADGSSGYAEGPGYFNYAMSLMLPYMRAYNNWGGAW
jgi:hypothetical protein